MGGRISIDDRPVAGASDHLAVTHQDTAHRNLAALTGGARFRKRHFHKRGHCQVIPPILSFGYHGV
jgi:hypothetical protein